MKFLNFRIRESKLELRSIGIWCTRVSLVNADPRTLVLRIGRVQDRRIVVEVWDLLGVDYGRIKGRKGGDESKL